MWYVGGEGRAYGEGAVSSPPASWVDPTPTLRKLIDLRDEAIEEVNFAIWEDSLTAEQQALANFFLGEAPHAG